MSETSHNKKSLTGWIPWTLVFASIVGFADAIFLTVKHFQGTVPPCVLFSGCETVTTSSYAVNAGVPVALLGALFYFSILLLSLAFLDRGAAVFLRFIKFLSVPGFIFTLWLIVLQLFVIRAVCVYCMLSATTSTIIFGLSFFSAHKIRSKVPSSEQVGS